ncbi:hypothetical protein C823_000235 [Eubacterium plexicaudatum ASF492]|nr:hypothetical protein C823_000235 [Eubacterium plexicaudatum ASF492]
MKLICGAKVERVDADCIYYTKNGEEFRIGDADTLVFAAGYQKDPSVEELLKSCGVVYHMIGDAHVIGTIKSAVSEGYETAKHI